MAPAAATPCSRRYTAVHHSGKRHKPVLWIVLHDTEGDTAASAARWFANKRSAGSAHLVVDDNECFRTLPNDIVPWAAPGANEQGFHIEQAGFAHWSKAQWLRHSRTLERAAWKTAYHCHVFGVPPVFARAGDLRRHRPGVSTHAECSAAFGGDHSDPGGGWPREEFMRLVVNFYADQLADLQSEL